jgi:hypothetical protein
MINGIFGGVFRGLGGGSGGSGMMRRFITSFTAPDNLAYVAAIMVLLAIVVVLVGLTVREYYLLKK